MRCVPLNDQKRLSLLSQYDRTHHWTACEEQRRCILCDTVFTGKEVKVSWFRRGVVRLHCPTPRCLGGPGVWVHPDNPLLSNEAWEDWDRILRDWEQEQESAIA